MSVLAIDEIIEGTVENLAFGGEGIIRYQGFVVFVAFTAPGDFVSCRITFIKRSYAKAALITVIKPSPQRINPRCPYFGTCGGCQLQHLNQASQLSYKSSAVHDAFKRIGHLNAPSLPVIKAPSEWSYRRHVTLQLKPLENSFKVGYIAIDNQSLVSIQTCPIFNEPNSLIFDQLQSLVSQLKNPKKTNGRVTLLKNHQKQYILSFQLEHLLKENLILLTNALKDFPLFAGIVIQTPGHKPTILGNIYCEEVVNGLRFAFTPQTFSQNHPEQSLAIYNKICELAASTPNQKILDLYCGFGMVSLLLAQQGHFVIGIEYSEASIQFARMNASYNYFDQIQFFQGSVEKILPSVLNKNQFDLVIVNPPRAGLSNQALDHLIRVNAKQIIYISCMPATLSRDLASICQKGYSIKKGGIYDMFPQTAHVETLIYLEKNI